MKWLEDIELLPGRWYWCRYPNGDAVIGFINGDYDKDHPDTAAIQIHMQWTPFCAFTHFSGPLKAPPDE